MPRPPVVRLERVSLEFEGKRALTEVSWRVREGESWAMVGANGAGKTSLISIINGYRWPTTGKVEILGRRFGEADLRELRTHVGLVSAYLEDWIPPSEKVVDLVVSGRFGATRVWKPLTREERAEARSHLRLLGCEEHIDKTISQLSQGERQRVLIARALMSEAKLLVLDEPCEGLDLGARESFLDGLSRVAAQRKRALVYVTHRMDEIPAGFSHALLLKEGMVLAAGTIGKTLTSANLSRCFGLAVRLQRFDGRYYAILGGRGAQPKRTNAL
ncbi:MAG: ATP-binding cassette domain-containing protein [Thaumarchaeota archaeon]|nr:ATP-binding cassette domain-containing protein [Nitrososphaerota archaeon]